jgi:hypothetical protein
MFFLRTCVVVLFSPLPSLNLLPHASGGGLGEHAPDFLRTRGEDRLTRFGFRCSWVPDGLLLLAVGHIMACVRGRYNRFEYG